MPTFCFRLALLLLILTGRSVISSGQSFSIETLVFLPDKTQESSGVIFINDRIVTHNDSGGQPVLYEIDPESGEITRELVVRNGSNVDWEDLAFDQQFIYVGDIGNNNGDRTDLSIYRISISDYFQSMDDSLSVDTIRYQYSDQVNFSSNPFTNYDAEAIISLEDSLYIFTKNWGDQHTNIYSLPKTPGTFQAKRVGRINTEGLITSAVYNIHSNEIMLTGYTISGPFLFRITKFDQLQFSQATTTRLPFDVQGSFQIEAIEAINESDYLLTSESSELGGAVLFRLNTDFVVGTNDLQEPGLLVFPNPVSHSLQIRDLSQTLQSITILDPLGRSMPLPPGSWLNHNQISLDLEGYRSGWYQLVLVWPGRTAVRKFVKTP